MDQKHPVMLVGSAGCGKTVLMNEKLTSLSENYAVTNIPFNYYTTSGNHIFCLINNDNVFIMIVICKFDLVCAKKLFKVK